jgi:hypothetical protein
VKTLLLCRVRNQWNIPKDVMLLILKYSVATCILDVQVESPTKKESKKVISTTNATTITSKKNSKTRARSTTEPNLKKKRNCVVM